MRVTSGKNPTRVAAGLKATLNNPHVSTEARERAAHRLEDLLSSESVQRAPSTTAPDHETNRVLGGYKATLNNDRTSFDAKHHAREILEAAGYTIERDPNVPESEHETRVIAGYKAALHNPRVSEAAKQHAKEFLNEHGAY
ncbi:hypothetical protein WOLCODRAFT_75967 [Wolfiporia cocos MD-104 SS10]|uniref:Conidiation protein 6 n=1 Tax=Wolfiporia cocos (strain MD-104) TaxID=742152 RepID=A0A2H3JPR6_WOLCO|nr:hypothetical protein WOLCODRAFT_75967 [Wolfiporia cocos MD-104 SS10]